MNVSILLVAKWHMISQLLLLPAQWDALLAIKNLISIKFVLIVIVIALREHVVLPVLLFIIIFLIYNYSEYLIYFKFN